MLNARIVLGLFLVSAGCGGVSKQADPKEAEASEPAAGGAAEGTPDFDAMMAREAGALNDVAVKGPGDAWSAQVGATAPPKVGQGEGFSAVEIPIGSEFPVVCQVFQEDIDPGATIAHILKARESKADLQRVLPRSIQVIDESPVVFVDAIYTAPTPKGKGLGHLKLAVHPALGRPVLCMHDELGYRQTFDKVVSGLCDSFKAPGVKVPQPSFVEVQSGKIGELPVGFERRMLIKEGPKRTMSTLSTLMLPASQTEMHLIDNYVVEIIDEKGYLEQGRWVEASGGQLEMNIGLTRAKGGAYRYEGELHGKAIKGEFKTKDPKGLPSSVATAHRLAREGRKAEGVSVKEQRYLPDLDPTKPYEVSYNRKKEEPAGVFHLEAGKLKLTGHVDEQGLFDLLELPVGAASVTFKREHIRGKI